MCYDNRLTEALNHPALWYGGPPRPRLQAVDCNKGMAIATRRPVLDTAGLRSQVRSIESGRDLTRPEEDRDRHRARSIAYRGRRDSGCTPDACGPEARRRVSLVRDGLRASIHARPAHRKPHGKLSQSISHTQLALSPVEPGRGVRQT